MLTASVFESRIPIDKSAEPYANNLPSALPFFSSASIEKKNDGQTHLTSKTVIGLPATSRRTSTSQRPSSSPSLTSCSFSLPLVLACACDFFSSSDKGAELGPATSPNVTTKAFLGAPRLGGLVELTTAWMVGAGEEDAGEGEKLDMSSRGRDWVERD
jgi:hypothetical protein